VVSAGGSVGLDSRRAFRFLDEAEGWAGGSEEVCEALAAEESAASLAEERVTLDDMSTHSIEL
jgi:hypothetical protein